MLKGIPSIISPQLIEYLMEMGHGDEILLADANFPAASHAKRLIRYDGTDIRELLKAILKLLPLDKTCKFPVALMSVLPQEQKQHISNDYRKILQQESECFTNFGSMEKKDFYERARDCFVVVITGDATYKGNIILRKGVIREE